MGRMYTVVMDAQAIAAAATLLRISAPSDAVVILHEVKVTQDTIETSEMLPLQIHRASTDGTGTSTTPEKLQESDAAFGGTCITDCTANPTIDGAPIWRESQNILNGWHYLPTPEGRIVIPPSARLCVHLDAAPDASTTFSLTAVIEEIG